MQFENKSCLGSFVHTLQPPMSLSKMRRQYQYAHELARCHLELRSSIGLRSCVLQIPVVTTGSETQPHNHSSTVIYFSHGVSDGKTNLLLGVSVASPVATGKQFVFVPLRNHALGCAVPVGGRPECKQSDTHTQIKRHVHCCGYSSVRHAFQPSLSVWYMCALTSWTSHFATRGSKF